MSDTESSASNGDIPAGTGPSLRSNLDEYRKPGAAKRGPWSPPAVPAAARGQSPKQQSPRTPHWKGTSAATSPHLVYAHSSGAPRHCQLGGDTQQWKRQKHVEMTLPGTGLSSPGRALAAAVSSGRVASPSSGKRRTPRRQENHKGDLPPGDLSGQLLLPAYAASVKHARRSPRRGSPSPQRSPSPVKANPARLPTRSPARHSSSQSRSFASPRVQERSPTPGARARSPRIGYTTTFARQSRSPEVVTHGASRANTSTHPRPAPQSPPAYSSKAVRRRSSGSPATPSRALTMMSDDTLPDAARVLSEPNECRHGSTPVTIIDDVNLEKMEGSASGSIAADSSLPFMPTASPSFDVPSPSDFANRPARVRGYPRGDSEPLSPDQSASLAKLFGKEHARARRGPPSPAQPVEMTYEAGAVAAAAAAAEASHRVSPGGCNGRNQPPVAPEEKCSIDTALEELERRLSAAQARKKAGAEAVRSKSPQSPRRALFDDGEKAAQKEPFTRHQAVEVLHLETREEGGAVLASRGAEIVAIIKGGDGPALHTGEPSTPTALPAAEEGNVPAVESGAIEAVPIQNGSDADDSASGTSGDILEVTVAAGADPLPRAVVPPLDVSGVVSDSPAAPESPGTIFGRLAVMNVVTQAVRQSPRGASPVVTPRRGGPLPMSPLAESPRRTWKAEDE